jgi:hypothetical protein
LTHPLSNLTPALFSRVQSLLRDLRQGEEYVLLPDRHNRELRSAGLFPVALTVGRSFEVWSWGHVFGVRVVTRRYEVAP